MQKETRTMKALIMRSGKQPNNFYITKEAISKIYNDDNIGKPLLNKIDFDHEKVCGYLTHTELTRNEKTNELELWGYYTYTFDGTDFTKEGCCSYEISYSCEDMQNHLILHNATLVGCVMVKE